MRILIQLFRIAQTLFVMCIQMVVALTLTVTPAVNRFGGSISNNGAGMDVLLKGTAGQLR
ncbi:MAG: hypothetical protein CSA79_03405 [Thiothrix nivea]|nr:MAG: hypothetical protein CSA79_03405 [Thiothrix nivea]